MKIKVCGMRNAENVKALAALKPDYMGFIFYRHSKRNVAADHMLALPKLPKSIKKTGVFVNATYQEIKEKAALYSLDAVQLHGDESPPFCKVLKQDGLEIIKAFGVHEDFYFYVTEPYQGCVDYFLFDTKTSEYGGSGMPFNWEILKNYPYSTPYFLSGGISPENLNQVLSIKDERLYAVDLNSKFELEPGLKNVDELKAAFEKLKEIKTA